MPTTIRSIIHPSGTNPDSGYYDNVFTDLRAWWASPLVTGNIVSRNELHIAYLASGFYHDSFLTMSSGDAIVDSTHYYEITAQTGGEFDGTLIDLDSKSIQGSYNFYSYGYIIFVDIPYTRVNSVYLTGHIPSAGTTVPYINLLAIAGNASFSVIDKVCVMNMHNSPLFFPGNISAFGISIYGASTGIELSNCLSINTHIHYSANINDATMRGISIVADNVKAHNNVTLYNSVATGMFGRPSYTTDSYGLTANTTSTNSIVKNNIACNNYNSLGSGIDINPLYVNLSYNASSDTSLSGVSNSITGLNPSLEFISMSTGISLNSDTFYSGGNYHLLGTSQLYGAGTFPSGNIFTDIDGDVQIVPWDIGLDATATTGTISVPSGVLLYSSHDNSTFIVPLSTPGNTIYANS